MTLKDEFFYTEELKLPLYKVWKWYIRHTARVSASSDEGMVSFYKNNERWQLLSLVPKVMICYNYLYSLLLILTLVSFSFVQKHFSR